MARPIDTNKRRELARRAVEVLMQEGLDLPNARLAEALGIKRPTLLYHFPTRAQIIEEALADLLMEQAEHVIAKMQEQDHPLRQLDAQIRAVHGFHHGREERVVFLSMAVASLGREHTERMIEVGDAVFAPQRKAMVEKIRRSIAQGRTRPCDAEALVGLVRGLNDGLMVQRVMTKAELGPIHDLLFDRLLRPLIVEGGADEEDGEEPKKKKKKKKKKEKKDKGGER